MRLHFPNPSRNFDEIHNRIRFWGYDSAIEVAFFIEMDALKQLDPKMINLESGYLQVFDTARNRIEEIANKVYVRDGKGAYSYVLVAEDF